jgi:hypothetical protein
LVVTVGVTFFLLIATHVLNAPLLLSPALVLHTSLVIKPPSFRRVTTVSIAWRGRRPAMPEVIHASTTVLIGLLLRRLPLFFPLSHSLGRSRRRAVVTMVPVHLRRHTRVGRMSARRRVRHARLRSMGTLLLMMRRVVRLMLRVSRFRRGHAIVMHTTVIMGAVRAVKHAGGWWWSVDTRTRSQS